MPRKKTTPQIDEATAATLEGKKTLKVSLEQVKQLLEIKIGETVAGLVSEGTLERENAERVVAVLQSTAGSCVDTVRANRGV